MQGDDNDETTACRGYAFGDGMNDKEMLEYVNVGIAVGNAKEGLKAVADEVTDDITNDGIYNAMKRHNLI